MIAKTQEIVAVNKLKKTYSVLANGINKAMADNEYSSYSDLFTGGSTKEIADRLFAQFNVVDRCIPSDKKGCGGEYKIKYAKKRNDGKGGIKYIASGNGERAVLSDGTIISVVVRGNNSDCKWEYKANKTDAEGNYISDGKGGYEQEDRIAYFCAEIFLDIDGPNGKNQFGYDNYSVTVTPRTLEQHVSYGNIFDTIRTGKLNYQTYSLGGKFKD